MFALIEKDAKELPNGALSAIAIGLKLRDQPRITVQFEAADESLAEDLEAVVGRAIKRVQDLYESAREDFRAKLPAESAQQIDQFLFAAVTGTTLKRTGAELEVRMPLGRDGAELKQFAQRRPAGCGCGAALQRCGQSGRVGGSAPRSKNAVAPNWTCSAQLSRCP